MHTTTSHLVQSMQISVNTLEGVSHTLTVWSHDHTVKMLKEQIENKEGIPIDKQRLFYAGMQLEDGHTLADCNIQEDSTPEFLVLSPPPLVCSPPQEHHAQPTVHTFALQTLMGAP